ncbi:MAG: hypothetical protein IJ323_03920 [Clostridia bacterium]|nr:hypothetical protein [Clostridia bacterium]
MNSKTKLILGTVLVVGLVGGILGKIEENSLPADNQVTDSQNTNDYVYNDPNSGYYEDNSSDNAAGYTDQNNQTSGIESAKDKFDSLMNDINAGSSDSSQSNTGSTSAGGNRFNTSSSNTSSNDKKESGVTIVQIGNDKTDNSASTTPSVPMAPTVKPSAPSTNTNTNTNTNANTNNNTTSKPNVNTNTNVNVNTKPSVSTPSSTKVSLDTTGDYSGLRLERQSDRNDFTLHNLNKSKINTADSLTGTEEPLIVAVSAFNAYKNQDGDSMAKLHYPNTKGASDTSTTENPFVAYKVLGYEKLPDSDVEKLNDSFESAKKLYGYNFDVTATEYYRITMEIYQYEPTEPNHSPYPNYEPDPYYFTALVYKADNSYYLHSFMTAK